MKITNENDLLQFLIKYFPNFETVWNSENNYFLEGNDFTSHGICAEFSGYFKEHYNEFSEEQLKILFNTFEELIENSAIGDKLGNAVCSCFLENISQTESGNLAKQFMGKRSQSFFKFWN